MTIIKKIRDKKKIKELHQLIAKRNITIHQCRNMYNKY